MLPKETPSSPGAKLIIGEAGLKRPDCGRKGHVLNHKDDSGRERCLCRLRNRRFGGNLGLGHAARHH